jgi:transcription-repair coupling factor (superfamily II helicase)
MDKDLLEETMMKFYNHEANVLICTTIIENGIDIPNANTIIIDNADRFGLSQLYQIKGRVGRGDRLGYAYLFYSGHKEMNDEAKKRLKTIKEFSELGSGYRIAMRDLSIRGAGDILGSEQSGFIDSVGIDMYLQILKETIDEKKNGVIKEETKTNTIINVDGYIPNKFESNDLEKIDLYKKIDALSSLDSIINFSNEILDLYGKTPDNVKLLLEKKRLEVLSDILYL